MHEPRYIARAVAGHLLDHVREVVLVNECRVRPVPRGELVDRVAGQVLDVGRHIIDRPALAVLPAKHDHRPDREQEPLLQVRVAAADQPVDLALELAERVVAGRRDGLRGTGIGHTPHAIDQVLHPGVEIRHPGKIRRIAAQTSGKYRPRRDNCGDAYKRALRHRLCAVIWQPHARRRSTIARWTAPLRARPQRLAT